MSGLYTDSWDNPQLEAEGSAEVPATSSDVLGATAAQTFAGGLTTRLLRISGDQINQGIAVDDYGRPIDTGTPPPPMLSPDEANAQFGIKGALSFDAPVSQPTAQDLYDTKRASILRADTIARGSGGVLGSGVARGAVSLATSLLDPLNLAAGFVPGLGEARFASLLGDSALGQIAARTAAGATAGAAGMAALEPLQALLDTRDHDDWSMAQALRDIAFGSVLGGGLHVLSGLLGDAFGNQPATTANPISARMEAAGYDARNMALRGAVGQMADGRAVDVQPALDLVQATEPPIPPTLRDRPQAAPGNYNAFTPSGTRVELAPEIVDARSVIASHADDGTVNPDYPTDSGLQPRDRSSAASQAQIMQMAAELEPSRLGASPEAGNGAPIVNSNDVVESGNGRTAAIRRMYAEPQYADQANAYQAHLQSLGFDTTGVEQPMLIGRRQNAMTPDATRDFVRQANERSTLAMSTAEQARADAGRAERAVTQYQPGAIGGPSNRDFVRAFMAQVPAEERGAMITRTGELSADGERRIRSALLGYSYGDALGPTLERMLNGDTEGMRSVAGALTDVSGAWGQMRRAAADGTIPADLDITPALGEAVQLLDRARQTRQPLAELLAQSDFDAPTSDAAAGLLRLMFSDDALRRPVSRAKLGELLSGYVDEALKVNPDTDMFGTAPAGAGDILRAVGRKTGGAGDAYASAADALALLRDNAAGPVDHPDDAVNAASNVEQVQRAPAVPGPLETDLAEVQQGAADLAAQVAAELKAGRLTETDAAELTAADAAAAKSEGDAKAFEAATACLAASAA